MSRVAAAVTRARSASVVTLALAALVAMPGVAGSATPPAPVTPATPNAPPVAAAVAPAELQALEAKMAQLQITSERFSIRTQGSFVSSTVTVTAKGTCPAKGKCHPVQHRRVMHGKPHLLDVTHTIEADIAAGTGETTGTDGRPRLIITGSTLYLYAPERSGRGRTRPWLRQRLPAQATSPLDYILPFSAVAAPTNLGGSGPYGSLINLLRTAVGTFTVAGPVTVDSQQTSEFTATVMPAVLFGFPDPGLPTLAEALPREKLQVFLSESGLPLRVVVARRGKGYSLTETSDLLAVNAPVSIKPPPANRTRRFPRNLDTVFRPGEHRRAKSKQ
jgi:hypothetical protein